MVKIKYEILDYWWEYFHIFWWSFSRPSNERLQRTKSPTREDIHNQHATAVNEFLSKNDDSQIKIFMDHLEADIKDEEDRKNTIESKAHAMVGQTGIAVTLLIGTLSFGSGQFKDVDMMIKWLAWLVFFLAILNLVVAGLHARNAVVLKEGYEHLCFDTYFASKSLSLAIEKIYIKAHNSYLNNVKGTYLKIAHWNYKCSLMILLIGALLLPPLIMFTDSKGVKRHNPKVEAPRQSCPTLIHASRGL